MRNFEKGKLIIEWKVKDKKLNIKTKTKPKNIPPEVSLSILKILILMTEGKEVNPEQVNRIVSYIS